MPSLSHALVPNSFPLLHLIIYLDSYCTSMVTSNLIVSHHPRPNASYPADLLSHCFPGPLPPNPFICHTCRKSPRKPNHCHRSETALPQLLSLPHIQDPLGVLYVAQPFPFPEESVKKPGGTGTPACPRLLSSTNSASARPLIDAGSRLFWVFSQLRECNRGMLAHRRRACPPQEGSPRAEPRGLCASPLTNHILSRKKT